MQFRLSVITIINRLLLLLLASVFFGWLVGHIFLVMFLVTTIVVIWHYHHLFKLIHWLWQSKALSPPQSSGLWGNLYDGLYRQVQQYRTKHKQANEKIRRFRDGAEALPDAALMLSDELTIEWCNKKAQYLLGVRWPEDLGQRIDNLLRAPEFLEYLAHNSFESPCLLKSPVHNDIQLEIWLGRICITRKMGDALVGTYLVFFVYRGVIHRCNIGKGELLFTKVEIMGVLFCKKFSNRNIII